MPVREVVDVSESGSPADQIYAAFEPHARVMRSAHIARAGRGRRPAIRQVECQLQPEEDPAELARTVAEMLYNYGLQDAGTKRVRYIASAFAAAADGHKKPLLVSLPITIGGDEDDDDETPTAARASAGLVRDVGDRHLRLMDHSIGLIEKLSPLVIARDGADTQARVAEASMRIEMRKLEIDYDRERQRAQEQAEASAMMWGTIADLSQKHKNLLDAIADILAAKAREMRDGKP